jgi:hypothetical protein
MGRPRKNRDNLVGRAGRQAIEQEDLQRESHKWTRRKATLARFAKCEMNPPFDASGIFQGSPSAQRRTI